MSEAIISTDEGQPVSPGKELSFVTIADSKDILPEAEQLDQAAWEMLNPPHLGLCVRE